MIKFKDLFGLVLVTGVMILAFITLSANQSKYLDEVDAAIKSGDAIVLSPSVDSVSLADFFVRKGYYDEKDAVYIAGSIARPLNKGLKMDNLGQLNKKEFRVSAEDAEARGGELVRAKTRSSRETLGWTANDSLCYVAGIPDNLVANNGDKTLKVRIVTDDEDSVEGVLVRLNEYYKEGNSAADSILAYAFTDQDGNATFSVASGRFYSVLPIRKGYEYGSSKGTRGGSDIASSPYTFRQRKHTLAPIDPLTFSSIKSDTALMVRTPQQYRDSRFMIFLVFLGSWWLLILILGIMDRKKGLKTDSLSLILLMTLSGICLLAMLSIPNPLNDMPRGKEMITAIVAGVVAIGILSRLDFISFYNGRLKLFGGKVEFDFVGQFLRWLARPFGEKIAALKVDGELSLAKTLKYYFGLLASVICLPLELIARLAVKILPKNAQWPNGLGYLLIAAFFIVMLVLFGVGPEGSDAKVNLRLPGLTFQPSELNKYLILLFMAAFFAKYAPRIQAFSEQFDRTRIRAQIRTVAFLFVAIAAVLMLYLVLLSDMGPALVLLITFILIYSFARKDFPQLILGVATFAVMLLLPSWLGMSSRMTLVMAVLWFILWIAFGAARKKLYESAIFMNLVLLVFMSGPQILSGLGFSEADRLANRMAVVGEGVWDNDAVGGDQVVNGLWALAQGGLSGQGLAKGNPSLVPANHTDMILSSIGEQMGWIMLALVVISFAILLHRSLLLARRTAHPFAFYLTTGVAVITGVQFLVIAFGSIGVIPLTGIAVPFLSHGKTSLILNLAAFGIVAALSRYEPLAIQKKEISKYDGMVAAVSMSFIAVAFVLLGFLFKYQVVDRDEILVRPAFVAGQRGERVQEYNPRIRLILRKLDSGNIYDRNGLLLATSHDELTDTEFNALIRAGLDEKDIRREFARNKGRYYPFGDHTLFMVGDDNTKWIGYTKNSNYPRGLAVEAQLADSLRGLSFRRDGDGKIVKHLIKSEVRISPYLPPETIEVSLEERDYSSPEFLQMLKDGPESEAVKQWNSEQSRKKRDVYLTVDAELQRRLQLDMDDYINASSSNYPAWEYKWSNYTSKKLPSGKVIKINPSVKENITFNHKRRVGVVILDAVSGELLTSAMWPLPKSEILKVGDSNYIANKNYKEEAYTDRDLGIGDLSAPGSTGKIMTALAAMSVSESYYYKRYAVYRDEEIDGAKEPPFGSFKDSINMETAINKSSNLYFINLLNDSKNDIYKPLSEIYKTVGVKVEGVQPYIIYQDEFSSEPKFDSIFERLSREGKNKYAGHLQKRKQGEHIKMNYISNIAWGQEIDASPLTMARVVSIVANGGEFVPTRYFMDSLGGASVPTGETKRVVSKEAAQLISKGMSIEAIDGAAGSSATFPRSIANQLHIGGKTGTPESSVVIGNISPQHNDGWYIFFCDENGDKAPNKGGRLAIAIKMDWASGSGTAKRFARDCILPALREAGYINY